MPFKSQSAVKFALHAIIHKSQQFTVFFDYPAIILHSSLKDPKTSSSGSAFRPPGRCRPMTQYVAAESA
ncbi:hypothetical protein CCP41_23885, partial [Salmonella enterica]|nr:hypothetical protein [Salmonella enterica]